MKALVIARRELAAYLCAPATWLVMALFLVLQGYAFWWFLELLNAAPGSPSSADTPHGAVLQYLFGGTFLYWLSVTFVVAAVTMRLVAEERRNGTLEPLLTAPVDEAEVIVGKYLGALGLYAALWLPTLLYVLVLASSAPPGVELDPGPIVAGYLGNLVLGASALALGLLFSTVTRHQILAAVLTFATLCMLLLAGALGDTLVRGGPWAPLLAHLNLFRHMEDFGRGIVDTRHLIFHAGLAALALFAATRAVATRARRAPLRLGGELVLLAAVVIGLNVLGARHYRRGDWTRGQTYRISPKTEQVVRALHAPVDVLVFMVPSGRDANDLYGDVRELLERARRLSPQLRVEYLDPDRERERLRTVGKKYGINGDDLEAGVIVVDSGTSSTFIPRDRLAEFDFSSVEEGRPPQLKAWNGEQALVSALLAVTEEKAPTLCFLTGHGEPAIDSFEPGEFGDFAEELRRDHHRPVAIDPARGIGADCDLVVVAQPQQPYGKRETDALAAHLERGGRLLVLLGPTFDARVTHFAPTGVEELLERWSASVRDDLVVDQPRLQGDVVAFAVSEGYADHPITRRLLHHRTLWSNAREVRMVARPGLESRELVHTSDEGWGETDLALFAARAELAYDPQRDVKGPVSLGVAAERTEGTGKGARLVVLGSAELAANRAMLAYNRDLLLSSVAWLLHAEPKIAIGPRTPEHMRLALDERQLARAFLVCVLALPLLVLLIGAGVFWVRRS